MASNEPSPSITINDEKYIFIGGIPTSSKTKTRSLKNRGGRKVVFVDLKTTDHDPTKWTRVYVSAKFYPKLCKTKKPWHGTGTLDSGIWGIH